MQFFSQTVLILWRMSFMTHSFHDSLISCNKVNKDFIEILWIYQMVTTLNMRSLSTKTWVIITGSAATKGSLGNCVICHFIIYFPKLIWGCSGLFGRGVLVQGFRSHMNIICFLFWNDNCFTKASNIFRFVQAMPRAV